jgi:hypothetical protein
VKRTITLKSGHTMKTLRRLRLWAGFDYDYAGAFTSPNWYGHKIAMRNGDVVVVAFAKEGVCDTP